MICHILHANRRNSSLVQQIGDLPLTAQFRSQKNQVGTQHCDAFHIGNCRPANPRQMFHRRRNGPVIVCKRDSNRFSPCQIPDGGKRSIGDYDTLRILFYKNLSAIRLAVDKVILLLFDDFSGKAEYNAKKQENGKAAFHCGSSAISIFAVNFLYMSDQKIRFLSPLYPMHPPRQSQRAYSKYAQAFLQCHVRLQRSGFPFPGDGSERSHLSTK